MSIEPPIVHVFCACGHEVQYHSQTNEHCLLQKLDESECPCTKAAPKHASISHPAIGNGVYDLTLIPESDT